MEKVQSDLSELRKQGEAASATIKLLNENLARLDQILEGMERRRAAQTPTPTATTPTPPSDRVVAMMSEPAADADGSAATATSIEETRIGHGEDHGSATARVTSVPVAPPTATTKAPASPSVPVAPAAASDALSDLPLVSPTRCSTYCGTDFATSPVTEEVLEAAVIYHVQTADMSVFEQRLAGYTVQYCLSIQICSGDVPWLAPAPVAASASSTTLHSNLIIGAPTTCLSGCQGLQMAVPPTTTISTDILRPPGKPPDSWGVLEVSDSQKYDDCLATEFFVGDLFVVRSPWPPPLRNSIPGIDSKLQSLTLPLITSKTKPIEMQFHLCYLCNAAMNYNTSSCACFGCLAFFVVRMTQQSLPPPVQDFQGSQKKQSAIWPAVREVRQLPERIEMLKLKPPWLPPLRFCMNLPTAGAKSAMVQYYTEFRSTTQADQQKYRPEDYNWHYSQCFRVPSFQWVVTGNVSIYCTSHFQWYIAWSHTHARYPRSNGFLAILNGEAVVHQSNTSTRVLTVEVRTRWIYHHILRGNTHCSEQMRWFFSHSLLQSQCWLCTPGHILFFCCALEQSGKSCRINLVLHKSWFQCYRARREFLYSVENFQWTIAWVPGDHTECVPVYARLSAVHALFSLTAIPWITHRIISLDVQSENSALQSLLCHPNASLLHEAPCLLLDTEGHTTSLLCWTGCWPVILSAVLIHYRSTMATSTYLLSSCGVIVVALMTVNVDALLSFDQAPWDPGGVQLQRHPNAAMPHLYWARDNVILLVCYSLTRPNFISPCWWKHLIGTLQWLTQIEIQKIDASSLMPGWPMTVHITQQVMIRLTKTSGMLHHPIYLNSTLNLSLLMTRTYSVQPMVKKADDACSTCLEVPQRLLLHFLLLANKMLRRTPQLKILNFHGEAVDDPWGQGSQKEGVMSGTTPSWSTKTRFSCYSAFVGPACKGVRERAGYICQYFVPTGDSQLISNLNTSP